jgi:hypothetical protein
MQALQIIRDDVITEICKPETTRYKAMLGKWEERTNYPVHLPLYFGGRPTLFWWNGFAGTKSKLLGLADEAWPDGGAIPGYPNATERPRTLYQLEECVQQALGRITSARKAMQLW